jgi:hypothetical protein
MDRWVPPYDCRDVYSRGGIALDLLSQRMVQVNNPVLHQNDTTVLAGGEENIKKLEKEIGE